MDLLNLGCPGAQWLASPLRPSGDGWRVCRVSKGDKFVLLQTEFKAETTSAEVEDMLNTFTECRRLRWCTGDTIQDTANPS